MPCVYEEDHSRARSGFAAENLADLRHLEFNLIRRDKVTEGGMNRKKKTMTWNEDKLLKALYTDPDELRSIKSVFQRNQRTSIRKPPIKMRTESSL